MDTQKYKRIVVKIGSSTMTHGTGNNVGIGSDDTLFALIDGKVKFEHITKTKKCVSVYAD